MGQNVAKDIKHAFSFKVESSDDIKNIFYYFFAEIFGTALFVFIGCMSCVEGMGDGKLSPQGALPFGIAAYMGCQVFHRRGGAHINPAITVMSLFFREMTVVLALIYIIGQCIGAMLGFGLLKMITPNRNFRLGSYSKTGLCSTVPNPKMNLFTTFAAEFLLTLALGLVVCALWDIRNPFPNTANLNFALTVFALVYVGGAYTGCSMNPARSLGPAVWNNSWDSHWVYWLAPILGAITAGLFYTLFFGRQSYDKEQREE